MANKNLAEVRFVLDGMPRLYRRYLGEARAQCKKALSAFNRVEFTLLVPAQAAVEQYHANA